MMSIQLAGDEADRRVTGSAAVRSRKLLRERDKRAILDKRRALSHQRTLNVLAENKGREGQRCRVTASFRLEMARRVDEVLLSSCKIARFGRKFPLRGVFIETRVDARRTATSP
jgi:hypothetical protein